MQHLKLSTLLLAIAPLVSRGLAHADQYDQLAGPEITVVDPNQQPGAAPPAGQEQESPIPPSAEGPAVQAQGGGYCFGGPHPAPVGPPRHPPPIGAP